MRPRVATTPILAPTRGVRSTIDHVTESGTVLSLPISARSQSAADAHALAIIQWHTHDKLFYEEGTHAGH